MIWALMAAWLAADGDVVTQVAAQLHHPPVVRGTFCQEQRVQGFKKPLLSRGRFLLVQGRGILWDTDKPFATRLSITHAHLQSTGADGRVLFDMGQGAALGAFHEILFAVLAADVGTLRKHFAMDGSSGPSWRLHLTPLPDDPVSHALAEVTLEGAATVERIALAEANGDHRTWVLHELPAQAPSVEENQRLE